MIRCHVISRVRLHPTGSNFICEEHSSLILAFIRVELRCLGEPNVCQQDYEGDGADEEMSTEKLRG